MAGATGSSASRKWRNGARGAEAMKSFTQTADPIRRVALLLTRAASAGSQLPSPSIGAGSSEDPQGGRARRKVSRKRKQAAVKGPPMPTTPTLEVGKKLVDLCRQDKSTEA